MATRFTQQDLKARFGLSGRLVARVGALYRHQVDLSELVLEEAGPGSALERLLLSPRLIADLAGLSDDVLAELVEEFGTDLGPLVVLQSDGGRTIALEDERYAAEGFAAVGGAPADASEVPDAPDAPDAPEAADGARPPARVQHSLATPGGAGVAPEGEVERAQWTLKTSVDPAAKVEAVRILGYADMPFEELGQQLVHALSDEYAEVRGEAARAFARLGVPADIAETCRRLMSGEVGEQERAVDRLVNLTEQTAVEHRQLIVEVMTRTLAGGPASEVRDALLEGLAQVWPAANAGSVEALMEAVVVALAAPAETSARVRRLCLVVSKTHLEALADAIEAEARRTGSSQVRQLLLAIAGELPLPEDRLRGIAEALAAQVDRGADLDPIFLRVEQTLGELGSLAVEPLVRRLGETRDGETRVLLVNLLDQICRSAKLRPPEKNSVLEVFIKTYEVAPQRVREVLIGAHLYADPTLGVRLRARMAREMLANIHTWRLERVVNDVCDAICRLGQPAMDSVIDLLSSTSQPDQQARAARILGELAARPGVCEIDAARRALAFCAREVDDRNREGRGDLLAAWGRIASRDDLEPAEVDEVVEGLRARVWGSSSTYRVLEGLGWAVSNPVLEDSVRGEVVEAFITLLEGKMPQAQGHLRKRGMDEVFYLGHETTVYTEMIPVLLDGLERIYFGAGTGPARRRRILEALLDRWHALIDYRVIWSPRLPIVLGEILGRFAQHESLTSEQRVGIVEALRARESNFQILGTLSELAELAPRSTALSEHLGGVAEAALGLIGDLDLQNDEDQLHLMQVMARLLHRPTLGADRNASESLKQRMLHTLFEGARKEQAGAVGLLERLVADECLPDALERNVVERLKEWV